MEWSGVHGQGLKKTLSVNDAFPRQPEHPPYVRENIALSKTSNPGDDTNLNSWFNDPNFKSSDHIKLQSSYKFYIQFAIY